MVMVELMKRYTNDSDEQTQTISISVVCVQGSAASPAITAQTLHKDASVSATVTCHNFV